MHTTGTHNTYLIFNIILIHTISHFKHQFASSKLQSAESSCAEIVNNLRDHAISIQIDTFKERICNLWANPDCVLCLLSMFYPYISMYRGRNYKTRGNGLLSFNFSNSKLSISFAYHQSKIAQPHSSWHFTRYVCKYLTTGLSAGVCCSLWKWRHNWQLYSHDGLHADHSLILYSLIES